MGSLSCLESIPAPKFTHNILLAFDWPAVVSYAFLNFRCYSSPGHRVPKCFHFWAKINIFKSLLFCLISKAQYLLHINFKFHEIIATFNNFLVHYPYYTFSPLQTLFLPNWYRYFPLFNTFSKKHLCFHSVNPLSKLGGGGNPIPLLVNSCGFYTSLKCLHCTQF